MVLKASTEASVPPKAEMETKILKARKLSHEKKYIAYPPFPYPKSCG